MTSSRVELPYWLRDVLAGESTDDVPNKRSESRHVGGMMASVKSSDDASAAPISVRILNASSQGIGLISRQRIDVGARLELTPDWVPDNGTPAEPVSVAVVHCTQTIQGYKVGCVLA